MTLRFLHVVGGFLMLGNVIVTGVWAELLWRWQGPEGFRPAARAIWFTDILFTVGGGALLTTAGVARAWQLGLPLWGTPWIRLGLVGLGASMLLWLAVLLPAQRTMLTAEGEVLRRAMWRWRLWGWIAVAPLLVALWAMTTKAGAG